MVEIQLSWQNGFQIGTVNRGSIHYVTKYHVNKNIYPEGSEPSFATMSRKPGLGSNYVRDYASYHDGNINRSYLLHPGGVKSRLPRYYKDKLYTESEREQIGEIGRNNYNTWSSQLEIDKHYRNNPDKNFYEYQQEKY